ncbi:MAG: hypothetical protein INH37_26395, partial [Myxococcaceae bacterium]|nr:hypothetical protein [Myxococcaceae bacterium]
AEGPHDVRARQTVTGATSGDGPSNRFVVDTRGPPTTLAVTPADGSEGSAVTASGVTEPNARVTVFVGMQAVGTVTADGNGLWQLTLPPASVPVGEHEVGADATDPAGNVGPRSQAVRITLRHVDLQWGGGGLGGPGGCATAPFGPALVALGLLLRRRPSRGAAMPR